MFNNKIESVGYFRGVIKNMNSCYEKYKRWREVPESLDRDVCIEALNDLITDYEESYSDLCVHENSVPHERVDMMIRFYGGQLEDMKLYLKKLIRQGEQSGEQGGKNPYGYIDDMISSYITSKDSSRRIKLLDEIKKELYRIKKEYNDMNLIRCICQRVNECHKNYNVINFNDFK